MIIDLHIHSTCSDGKFTIKEILSEAKARKIGFLSITDHDSIGFQFEAVSFAKTVEIRYVSGVELNVTFSHVQYREGKAFSLDFLGYEFDPNNQALKSKLENVARYRDERASKIFENLNSEFAKEGLETLTKSDFREIEASADGVLGRPHIADYLIKKKIVKNRQEAFDKYLVKCDVPKYPLYLKEASKLIRDAGGRIILAHPNDPNGTSLAALTKSLDEQTSIVQDSMLEYIDGIECWHSRNDSQTTKHYVKFTKELGLILTGGSDCHQKPILMGAVNVPGSVANQF
jgi:3',5'-nucleoside bisphosphate phosphatase